MAVGGGGGIEGAPLGGSFYLSPAVARKSRTAARPGPSYRRRALSGGKLFQDSGEFPAPLTGQIDYNMREERGVYRDVCEKFSILEYFR